MAPIRSLEIEAYTLLTREQRDVIEPWLDEDDDIYWSDRQRQGDWIFSFVHHVTVREVAEGTLEGWKGVVTSSAESRTDYVSIMHVALRLIRIPGTAPLTEGFKIQEESVKLFWERFASEIGLSGGTTARFKFESDEAEPIVTLPFSPWHGDHIPSAFTNADGITLSKRVDDSPSGLLLYDVELRRYSKAVTAEVRFKTTIKDVEGDTAQTMRRAVEIVGFAMRTHEKRHDG